MTVFFRLPLSASTIPLTLIPKLCKNCDAFCDGLIKDARPDLMALAPSDALIPPSFIAVRKNARSLTSPPSCLTTGAAFGIAIVRSSMLSVVWFSTAFKKSMFLPRSCAETPNAFVRLMVVSSAFCWSTPPRTASFADWLICAKRSEPVLPIAAAWAAISMVSATARPY